LENGHLGDWEVDGRITVSWNKEVGCEGGRANGIGSGLYPMASSYISGD
jgi:hypothetical protein